MLNMKRIEPKNPHAVALGRKGGQKKSNRKRLAVIKNLQKANHMKRVKAVEKAVEKSESFA